MLNRSVDMPLYFAQAFALALAGRVEEAKPIVRLALALEPAFRTRLFAEIGMALAIADKLAEGGRLLGGCRNSLVAEETPRTAEVISY
jgi:hypothetical protein